MHHSRLVLVLCGLAFVAAGLFPMLDALDYFPGSASRLNAPRWVVLVVASLFILCGAWLVLMAAVGEAMARSFGMALGIAIVVGLGATLHWIAFGGGDRSDCGGGISAFGIGYSAGARELECRAAFGYGALILDAVLLNGLAAAVARRSPTSRALRVLETASRWLMGLLLLPLLLVVLLFTKARTAGAWLAGKWRGRAPDPPPQD